jgi:hypothetical protein
LAEGGPEGEIVTFFTARSIAFIKGSNLFGTVPLAIDFERRAIEHSGWEFFNVA